VDVLAVYRTILPEPAGLAETYVAEWITFTSSSTVENTVKILGLERLRQVKIASIGPVTSATVRKLGLEVAAEASPYTVEGLVREIQEAR
jgi:uroporphyrinogen III methyltransferase/synthase